MSSAYATRWERFKFTTWPFSRKYKVGPHCRNYHTVDDRYCTCCIDEHTQDFHGGVWDFEEEREISLMEYKTRKVALVYPDYVYKIQRVGYILRGHIQKQEDISLVGLEILYMLIGDRVEARMTPKPPMVSPNILLGLVWTLLVVGAVFLLSEVTIPLWGVLLIRGGLIAFAAAIVLRVMLYKDEAG